MRRYYVVTEYRSYARWISIYDGHKVDETIYFCNAQIQINARLDHLLIDKKSNDLLENESGKLIAYDGRYIFHEVYEIDEEKAQEVIKSLEHVVEENYTEKELNRICSAIKECNDVCEFMKMYNTILNIVQNNLTLSDNARINVLNSIDAFNDNMQQIAKKKNEKQCIFCVYGDSDEMRGLRIIKEYVYPDGRKEKIDGWEYGLKR